MSADKMLVALIVCAAAGYLIARLCRRTRPACCGNAMRGKGPGHANSGPAFHNECAAPAPIRCEIRCGTNIVKPRP